MTIKPTANLDERFSRMRFRPRLKTLATGLLLLAGLIVICWFWWSHRRYQEALLEIENEVAEGQYSAACRNIKALMEWRADADGGLRFQLGSCELARGKIEAAREAWASIEPGSEFSERAILGRMFLARADGKPAEAERLILKAAVDPRNHRPSLMAGLVPILLDLGRQDEAIELIRDRWEDLNSQGEGALEPALKLLLQHVDLTTKSVPADGARAFLDEAARLAPEDDRVWLGRANLAIREGNLEDAARLLDDCEKKRKDDRAIWRSRLRWAMAAEKVEAVERAMTNPPKGMPPDVEQHRIHAWIARHRGDLAKERGELEQLVAADPEDFQAYDRLAEIHKQLGQPSSAAEVTQKRDATRELLDRYLKLHRRNQPIRDAEELARIADRLGRGFEARGFLTIAVFQEPDRSAELLGPPTS